MQVTSQFALSHFDEISAAVDRGEEVEIVRPGKPGLHLVTAPAPNFGIRNQEEQFWLTPERPRSELFGSLSGKMTFADDWNSPETNKEIQDLFEGSEVFRET